MRLVVLLLLVAGFGLANCAQAASWECPKPVGIAEPVACGDAELTTLEAQVTAELNAAAAKLSPISQARLRDGQAGWRKYLAVLCLGEPQPGDGGVADCLKQEYDIRRAQLVRAVEIIGGVTLFRAERFDAHPPKLADEAARPVLTEIAWPQLDRAAGPAQRGWNEAMAKAAELLAIPLDRQNPDTDIAVDYRIDAVVPDRIQAVFSRDLYIHGAAHGDDMTESTIFLLQPGRMLAATDLFDAAKPWRAALAALAYRALAEAAVTEDWHLWAHGPDFLADLVGEPSRWLLTKDGLALHFDPYDVADYAAGIHDVLVPWPALVGYLQAAPMVKIPPR